MVPKNKTEFKARKDVIKGIQIPKSKLNVEEDMKVKISNPSLKDEGFFSGKYLTFIVEVPSLGTKVERKDKDFNMIRDYLVKAFPHVLVPAWPEFMQTKTLDKSFLRKRESLLSRFMNKLMNQEELKASPVLVDFMFSDDFKQVSKQIKIALDSLPKMKFLKDFPSTTGEHKINVTKRSEHFCNFMEKYYTSHEVLFKKFYYLGKKLSSDLMETSKTLQAMSLCAKHITVLYEMGNSKPIAQVYQDMSEHLK